MKEFKRKLYKRGSSYETTIPMPLLFALDPKKKYNFTLKLLAKENIQIRDNAIEAGRLTSTRLLEKEIGKTGFHMKINTYPHQILRENPLAAGAGADRMSTGMKNSFGKVIGFAARVKKGQAMVVISVNTQHLDVAKKALKRISYKMPCKCSIEIIQNA